MAKITKKSTSNKEKEEMIEEYDYSEGFGGIIPEDISFTKNIGCASNDQKKKEK